MSFLNFPVRSCLFAVLSLLVLASCKPRKKTIKSPPGYDFSKVGKQKLEVELKEISGLAWDNTHEEFLAHFDEKGILFTLDRETKKIKARYQFGGKGDYEDIAIYKGTPYVLRSDGMLTKLVRSDTSIKGEEVGKLPIEGTNDFETLYADTARNALVLLCKNCDMDSKQTVSAFAYYPETGTFTHDPIYKIDALGVEKMAPHKTSKLQPSAAGIHPRTKKLIVISSAANLLVIADPVTGKPEKAFELGKKLFPQPEGLTFRSNGMMFISNEGVKEGSILSFEYKGKDSVTLK